jgi:protein SCO1/2
MAIVSAQSGPGRATRQRGLAPRFAPLATLFCLIGLLGGLAACAPSASNAVQGQAQTGHAAPGGAFTLVDQDGKPTTQSVLNGKWSIVFFGYTFCPDFCPTTLTTLGQAMAQLGPQAKDVQVVFITVDPARDTPAEMKTYLSSRVFPRNMIGLTGTPAQISRAAKDYFVFYQKEGSGSTYTMDHSTALYLMGPDGQFRTVIADGLTPQQDAQQISQAMRGT